MPTSNIHKIDTDISSKNPHKNITCITCCSEFSSFCALCIILTAKSLCSFPMANISVGNIPIQYLGEKRIFYTTHKFIIPVST